MVNEREFKLTIEEFEHIALQDQIPLNASWLMFCASLRSFSPSQLQ